MLYIYLVMVKKKRLQSVRVEAAWTLLNIVINIILLSVEAQNK